MAFLDNSGDIILDAVLTEAGRRKLARGDSLDINFFALGDDEINYNSYNIAHPSGSAYYDLEVLQTPILESITGAPGAINHGLMSNTNSNLLYLPTVKINTKDLTTTSTSPTMTSPTIDNTWRPYEGTFLMLLTDATFDSFIQARDNGHFDSIHNPSALRDSLERHVWRGYTFSANSEAIIIESGLDTTDVAKNSTSRNNLVVANSLASTKYYVDLDTRLFTQVWAPQYFSSAPDHAAVLMDFDTSTGQFEFAAMMQEIGLGFSNYGVTELKNYVRTDLASNSSTAKLNLYVEDPGAAASVTSFSAISGPTADVTALAPIPNVSRLGSATIDTLWTDLGKKVTGASLIPGSTGDFASKQFHFIDTTVYIYSAATNASTQFTIRLIRQA